MATLLGNTGQHGSHPVGGRWEGQLGGRGEGGGNPPMVYGHVNYNLWEARVDHHGSHAVF